MRRLAILLALLACSLPVGSVAQARSCPTPAGAVLVAGTGALAPWLCVAGRAADAPGWSGRAGAAAVRVAGHHPVPPVDDGPSATVPAPGPDVVVIATDDLGPGDVRSVGGDGLLVLVGGVLLVVGLALLVAPGVTRRAETDDQIKHR